MHNLFDSTFNGMAGSEFYRAQVFPDLFPHEKRMLTENWPYEERAPLVGGEEAKRFYLNEIDMNELREEARLENEKVNA